MRPGLRRSLLAAGSAVLLAAALPNEITQWGNPLLAPIAIAPFLAAVATARRPGLLGALFGSLHTLLSSFWLVFFQQWAIWTLGGVVLAYAGFGALLGAVLGGVARATALRPGRALPGPGAPPGLVLRPFLLASVWTVYEYLKSTGFLGYPWGLLAHPLHNVLPLIQIADVTGVWGVTLLVALVNALIAEGILRGRAAGAPTPWRAGHGPRQLAAVAALVALAAGYGGLRLAPPAAEGGRVMNVLLVQPNGDPWSPFNAQGIIANQTLTEEAVAAAAAGGRHTDLVVWSETSLPRDPAHYAAQYRRYPPDKPLIPYLRELGVPHLSGAAILADERTQDYMNGAVLVLPTGEVVESYGKQHPVPFAEAIPFWENPVVREFFSTVVGIDYPWVMGTRSVVFTAPLQGGGVARFGVPICFEDAFGDLNRAFVLGGADLLVNISNDSWSRTVSALIQHFVVAKFRTVETRRPLVRSTNGGITAVVDAQGAVTELLPWFEPGYVHASIELPAHPRITAYVRFGDWLPVVLGVLLVAHLAVGVWRRRRSPRATP